MSLQLSSRYDAPKLTVKIAKSSFPNGNVYICLKDKLGSIFKDEDFLDVFPTRGQPAIAPWRLALITIMQFGENLSDRQAADAVRGRIDWKYLLGLEIDDAGFNYSVLSEFRQRLLSSNAEGRLLSILLKHCTDLGVLKARGKQRTDSTHVLSSVRNLNRLELIGETMRSALNFLSRDIPDWVRTIADESWYKKYSHRVENYRLPDGDAKKEEYALSVGEDGFKLLGALWDDISVQHYLKTPKLEALKTAWNRHFIREDKTNELRFKTKKELSASTQKIESPYDLDARFRTKRDVSWTGYMTHLTETCDDESNINVITHVLTTAADVHDIHATEIIQKDLHEADLTPAYHIVDSAYISLSVLLGCRQKYNIDLIGPPREGPSWRSKVAGAYTLDKFTIDWNKNQVTCPQNKVASYGTIKRHGNNYVRAVFSIKYCDKCDFKDLCIRNKLKVGRTVIFPCKEQYEAKQNLLSKLNTEAGKKLYNIRAGVEGTMSQGARKTGLRKSRYRGLNKTNLQEIAGAAAMNIFRLADWFNDVALAKTRDSNFQKLAPKAA